MNFYEIDLNNDPSTIDAVRLIFDAFYSDANTFKERGPYLLKIMTETTKTYCLEVDNEIVGTGALLKSPLDRRIAHLTNIAIDESLRGHGYGEKIVSELESKGKKLGCFFAELRPYFDTEEFYSKYGYSPSESDNRLYEKFL
jgi:N-acetylglutamate synthase-like GNAT family acetyltransferase